MERLVERWIISRLTDDHVTVEHIEVRIMGDEDGHITNVFLKTSNGLKHYGSRIPEGIENFIVRSSEDHRGDAEG